MTVRCPPPLRPGDRIGVTSPSSGVPDQLLPRLAFCLDDLRRRGYDVVVGECMDGAATVSAPAADRAAELSAMLADRSIRAVVPPWGGELAVELLPHLDLAALADAEPTWLVGFSDLSTLLLPLTTVTGWATLHGQNLMDTPYRVPAPLRHWLDVVALAPGDEVRQGPSSQHRSGGFDDWVAEPTTREWSLDAPGGWTPLVPGDVRVRGRLLGGCLETVSVLAGTAYGDVPAFARAHAPEGVLVYVEAAEAHALDVARHLWRLRLAGWFDQATGVLVGRTHAPERDGFTQRDAVVSALGDLDLPVVLDVDCGHVAPHLSLVNGALADLVVTAEETSLTQVLP